jgi:hypothetical protein
MIIFYGSKSSHVKSEYSEDGVCPSCETSGQMIMSTYSIYAHVFWIPLFPLYKKVYATCNECESVYELNEMPPDLRAQCVKFRRAQRFPIWNFAGVIAVTLIIAYILLSGANSTRKVNDYLKNPQVNDVYYTTYEENSFSTMKIVEITKDSVYFADNEYYTDRAAIASIDKDENYDFEELYSFTIEDLISLKKAGVIVNIIRK